MLSLESSFETRLAQDFLNHVGMDLQDNLEPLLKDWLEYYRNTAQPEIFKAHEGGSNGGGEHPRWKPLSAKYLASARKRLSPHAEDILQLSGDFRDSITRGSSQTNEHIVMTDQGGQVVFGSMLAYPAKAGAGEGGSRQAMYITTKTAQMLADIANHHLSGIIVKYRKASARGTP